ncbi:hypothetical protein [Amycolatopsis tolypomycina]|nr:hypothetical protein [Amycolatopsis tolypomycina]
MLTEDAHRRMTETLRRVEGEPAPDSFPVQVRWDPAARRLRWVCRRHFAGELRSALAVRPLFAAGSRIGAAPGDERSALLGRYARWCGRGARLKSHLDLFDEAVPAVLAAVFVVSAVVAPLCLWGPGNLGRVLLAGELVMVFATVIISSAGVEETRADRAATLFTLALIAGGEAATLTLGGSWTISVGDTSVEWSRPLGLLLLLGSCLLPIFFFALLAFAGSCASSLFGRYAGREGPAELALFSLALALAQLVDRAPGERRLPSAAQLRSVATCIEGLGRDVDLPDARHRRVFRGRIRSAAEAVREKALWVALPKADTQAALRSFVVELMTTVLDGTYDELPDSPATKWHRVRAVVVFLRALVIGALPIGVLWLIHRFGVQLPSPVGATATLFAVLWAFVTLLMVVDPALRERADLVRSVTGLLSGSKPEK